MWSLIAVQLLETTLICEHSTEVLDCGSRVIHIYDVNYGRTDKKACSCEKPDSQLANTACFKNTTHEVKGECEGKTRCSLKASNEGSDPCPNIYKYLNISYTCVPPKSSFPSPVFHPMLNYTLGDLVFVSEPMSWVGALHDCAKNGFRLVHILDNYTQTRVAKLLAAAVRRWGCMEKVWVGLERCMINPQAPWEWSGGAAVGDYKRWITSFPRNPCCFHCGQLVQEGQGGAYLWQDACCQEQHPFICQQTSPDTNTDMCQT